MTTSDSWKAVLALAPQGVRGRLKALADSPEQVSFVEFALKTLEGDGPAGKPGPQSSTLLDSEVVIRVISDPALSSQEEATQLAQAAARLDQRIDSKILAALTSSSKDWPHDVPEPRMTRVLELIDAVSDCRVLVIPLMKFAKVPAPKIRSKAVKLMARASQNTGWAESILSDPDPRVRSNLLEGLVDQMGRGAEPLLRRAIRDPHHRVSTTALWGLAKFGDTASLEELKRLSAEGDDAHKVAAAWALGQLDKPTPASEAPRPTA